MTVVSAVIKPGIMVMLLLSFSAFSATTTTKKTSSSRGNEPPLLARPFAPSRFEKIVTNVVYYTVAFFSVHNSFVKWNNNLLHGKYKLFLFPLTTSLNYYCCRRRRKIISKCNALGRRRKSPNIRFSQSTTLQSMKITKLSQ